MHHLAVTVDGEDLRTGADVQPEACLQALGRVEQERPAVADDSPDVVREPAVGERDMRAALEHNDLAPLAETPGTRGGTRATGHTADDHHFFTH